MAKYSATIELWPQHGYTDKDVGGRVHKIEFRAEDIRHAAAIADLVATTMQRGNPLSWNAPVTELKRLCS